MKYLIHLGTTAGCVASALLLLAALLHLIPRLGSVGRRMSESLCRAPALDWVVGYFTAAPIIVGLIVAGSAGFVGAIVGQVASVLLWTAAHEAAYRDDVKGPRIVKVLNQIIGPWRNHAALWLTAIVTPLFTLVRLAEALVYPPIRMLTGFPKYNSGDWVNVSRQKFRGLVGHDLIWCLYCDWMTGVWSLGSEMLRNVESFWCPIRFDNDKKCANCAVDFPDINGGWVPADADMQQVTSVLEDQHTGQSRAWFGHPVRITVRGNELVETQ
jgi:hypothetical protein